MLEVSKWMIPYPIYVTNEQTIQDASQLMITHNINSIPVIDTSHQLINFIQIQDMMQVLLKTNAKNKHVSSISKKQFQSVQQTSNILTLNENFQDAPVVDDKNKLVGLLREQDVSRAFFHYIENLSWTDNAETVLSIILESAYEGIAVVNEDGILIEFNKAYARFTGTNRLDAIGRHVTEVIENTNLHQTVKTQMPERNVIQNIQGQDMIVNRIPIRRNGKLIGAIGMLIFEGVSEVYHVYDRLQSEKIINSQQSQPSSVVPEEENHTTMDQMIGDSELISNLKRKAREAAQTRATILITGEVGTGKKMYAQMIHSLSFKPQEDFVHVDCKELTTALFSPSHDEGLLHRTKGIVYLENIDALSMDLQNKLLHLIQTDQNKLNNKEIFSPKMQLILSTTSDIHEKMRQNEFNHTLYQEVTTHIKMPPLRERKEDIPALLSYYIKKLCKDYKVSQKSLSPQVISALTAYEWPENVKELIHVLEKLITSTNNQEINLQHLPKEIQAYERQEQNNDQQIKPDISLIEEIKAKREEKEKKLIISILEKSGGNKSMAARKLGIHRTTLYEKLKKYNL